jgi:hypothetical protein
MEEPFKISYVLCTLQYTVQCTLALDFPIPSIIFCAEILEEFMGAWKRVGIGLSYGPARLHSLVESITLNRFQGSLKV